jgi:tripartite-type tricarboxylate transporter receptor subunit TctC
VLSTLNGRVENRRWGRLLVLGCALLALSPGCRRARSYPHRPILLVCPWAQGGGTDRVSRTVAAHLEQELGVPVNVINATGGKGVTGHSRGLTARPDGYTITMITLELNMMHWSGLTELTIDDCIPLMSLNEDYAALLVRNDSPWTSLKQLETAISQSPGSLKASGTTTGGAWHLALAGWLLEAGLPVDSVNWISSTGAAPSLQELISGGLDMVCCALPEAQSLLRAGEVRALGVMAPHRAQGYEQVPTFAELGTNCSLGGWRALAVPLGTPEPVQQKLLAAIGNMASGKSQVGGLTFPQAMEQEKFDHTIRAGDELIDFLRQNDQQCGALLTSQAMRKVNHDPFPPLTFPGILLGLIALTLIAGVVQSVRAQPTSPAVRDADTPRNYVGFGLTLAAVVAYVLWAETVGFVLMSFAILLVLAVWSGAKLRWAVPLAVVFPPAIYQLFAHALRVPLPQGWLGW